MIGIALLLAATAQQAQPAPLPKVEGPFPWPEMETIEENAEEARNSIKWTHERAACLVKGSGDKIAATLAKDYRSPEYKRSFATIFQNNATCFGRRGGLPSPTLALTGAMAEHLLERDKTALNVRLARAAAVPAPTAMSDAEGAAICTVRSVPDQVAAWLATDPASPQSVTAAQPVERVYNRCTSGANKTNVAGTRLRALVALAALRSVNTSGAAAASN